MISYNFAKDVTADVVAGDVDIIDKRKTQDDDTWEFAPAGFLLKPATPGTFDHQTIVCKLYGKKDLVTLELESGVVHPIALGGIIKAGTTTDGIILFGIRQ